MSQPASCQQTLSDNHIRPETWQVTETVDVLIACLLPPPLYDGVSNRVILYWSIHGVNKIHRPKRFICLSFSSWSNSTSSQVPPLPPIAASPILCFCSAFLFESRNIVAPLPEVGPLYPLSGRKRGKRSPPVSSRRNSASMAAGRMTFAPVCIPSAENWMADVVLGHAQAGNTALTHSQGHVAGESKFR